MATTSMAAMMKGSGRPLLVPMAVSVTRPT
ncbi:Uncharacterised protein [Bordetella pertussis]|nr:Uncharacterised protein [Bordetella pertussis]CPM88934.1 Uncharacterised protein [Bordetella pertussis]